MDTKKSASLPPSDNGKPKSKSSLRRSHTVLSVVTRDALSKTNCGGGGGGVHYGKDDASFVLPCCLNDTKYTSLKDLLPSSPVPSPTAATRLHECDIPIRNRLVKHAAYAYLQPMEASPTSSRRRSCFRRFGCAFECFGFIEGLMLEAIHQVFDCLQPRSR